MARAFIAVGSNIEPEENVARALAQLHERIGIDRLSTFYRTTPFDRPESPPFINGMLEVTTTLDPRELKQTVLRSIERHQGRHRTGDKSADRTLDLDLVVYDDLILESPDLVLPDPDLARRPFLAHTLCELAPALLLPGSGTSIRSLAEALGTHGMEPLPAYTARLRRSIHHG